MVIGSVLFLGFLLISTRASMAEQPVSSTDEPTIIELTAPIMKIDLKSDLMIVAEKKIQLLSSVEDGKKKWKTVFLDANGKEMSVQLFKQRDLVLVKGTQSAMGDLVADEITRLPKKQSTTKTTRPSSPLQLKRGVWSN